MDPQKETVMDQSSSSVQYLLVVSAKCHDSFQDMHSKRSCSFEVTIQRKNMPRGLEANATIN